MIPMRAHTWEPGGFPPWVALCAKLAVLGAMLIRGADLLAGDTPSTARRLTAVESAAPLWLWGLLFVTAATVGLGSIIARFGLGVLVAHMTGCLGYVLLAIGIITDVVIRTQVTVGALVWPGVVLVVGVVATAMVFRWSRWQHAEVTAVGITTAATLAAAAVELDGLRNATVLLTIGIIHGLLAIGTASTLRQDKIEREGVIL